MDITTLNINVPKELEKDLASALNKLEYLYPQHKVFALDAIGGKLSEKLSKISKAMGYSKSEELLNACGFEKISGSKVYQLQKDLGYNKPGCEPEQVKDRVENAINKLLEYYPDKIINESVNKTNSKLQQNISAFSQYLGYSFIEDFLRAYGFTCNYEAAVGRPSTVNPETFVAELKKKYPEGTTKNVEELIVENPEFPWKSIKNKSSEYFGMSLGQYLVQSGIIIKPVKETIQEETVDYKELAKPILKDLFHKSAPIVPENNNRKVYFKIEKVRPELSDLKGKKCYAITRYGEPDNTINFGMQLLGAIVTDPMQGDLDYLYVYQGDILKNPPDNNKLAYELLCKRDAGEMSFKILAYNMYSQFRDAAYAEYARIQKEKDAIVDARLGINLEELKKIWSEQEPYSGPFTFENEITGGEITYFQDQKYITINDFASNYDDQSILDLVKDHFRFCPEIFADENDIKDEMRLFEIVVESLSSPNMQRYISKYAKKKKDGMLHKNAVLVVAPLKYIWHVSSYKAIIARNISENVIQLTIGDMPLYVWEKDQFVVQDISSSEISANVKAIALGVE